MSYRIWTSPWENDFPFFFLFWCKVVQCAIVWLWIFQILFLCIANLDIAQVTVILLRVQTPGGKYLQLRKTKKSPIFSLFWKSELLRRLDESLSLIDLGISVLIRLNKSLSMNDHAASILILPTLQCWEGRMTFSALGLVGSGPTAGCLWISKLLRALVLEP